MSPFMIARYDEVQGIKTFGFTGGELSSLYTWSINSSKARTRRPLMGDRDANLSHGRKD